MGRMNVSPKERVHFIGIGGIGMSGIARMYLTRGYAVQGSDLSASDLLAELEKMGARIMIGHDSSHISGATVVVYSSSIGKDHPERVAAAEKGIRVIHRADALAALCLDKFTIAVTGTHGKTTTTALTGLILKDAGHDPSVVVGGVVDLLGGNARTGRGEEMVIEADESDASFLKFSPDIEIITNIEKEHLDHYGTVEKMEDAYRDFIRKLRPGGRWIGCGEDPCVRRLAAEKINPCILYGFDPAFDFYATDIAECPSGQIGVSFKVWNAGRCLGSVRMGVPGRHNALNALAAIAAATLRGVEFSVVQQALLKFGGAGRRFDVRYEGPDVMIVDDYAHHPTEILKTLAAAKALGRKRIFAVFQPHRYSRTESMLAEFAGAFADADKIFITDIYAAGEKPIKNVSAESVCRAVLGSGHPDVSYVPRAQVENSVRGQIRPGDLVMVLGAGDIYRVAKELSFFRRVRGKVLREEPLARHTTLKIGGPAEYWIEPEDLEDLKTVLWECRQRGMKVRVIGAGSNVLAADEGVRGAVIYLGSPYFREIKMAGGSKVLSRAGVVNSLFIQFALQQGLGGFEFLSGIPGNVGGAVAMNAGSHGESTDRYLEEAVLLGFDGRLRRVKKEELDFRYRHSGIKNEIVVEAVFSFPKASAEAVMKKLDEYREHRAKTQDLTHASAGCLFKNPEMPGYSSGKLIDEAGLKGFSVGKAGVSEKHANYMINLGGATAKDVSELVARVRDAVKRRSGVELETEVRLFADPPSRRSFGKIAVLAGGPSGEREVSLVSGQAVHDALKEKGYEVLLLDPAGDFIDVLKNENVSIAFNAVHGTFGEDGTLQRMLDEAGIAYTGDGPEVSEMAFDKARAQAVFAREGILVPENQILRDPSEAAKICVDRFPVVVKPSKSGSSVGVTIVQKREDLADAFEEAFRYSDTVLVEEYVQGRELTVGFLGDQALPVVEVIPKDKFYDYRAKYKSSDTRYEFPAKLTPEETLAVQGAAQRAYKALGCEVMGRVDVILSGRDAYVLEINTIPGLTGKSLLPKAAAASGIEFGDLCVRIMELSKQRVSAN